MKAQDTPMTRLSALKTGFRKRSHTNPFERSRVCRTTKVTTSSSSVENGVSPGIGITEQESVCNIVFMANRFAGVGECRFEPSDPEWKPAA
jgi:hypothetical protein